MEINYVYYFIGATILMIILALKRPNILGLHSAYIALLIVAINALTIMMWVFMYNDAIEVYNVYTSGTEYTGTVISYTKEEIYDSDTSSYYTMMHPTIRFATDTGEIVERELNIYESDMHIGDTFNINYNKETDVIITLGFNFYINKVSVFMFWLIFTLLFIGLVLHITNADLAIYKRVVSGIGYYFFPPFVMIGFSALLVYAVISDPEMPIGIKIVMYFFVFILAIGFLTYILFVIRRIKEGLGSWIDGEGECEEDCEEDYEEYYGEDYEEDDKED